MSLGENDNESGKGQSKNEYVNCSSCNNQINSIEVYVCNKCNGNLCSLCINTHNCR